MRIALIVSSAFALFVSDGCTPLASVKRTHTRFASTGGELANAEKYLAHAGKIGEREPLVALCDDLRATRIAANALDRDRSNSEALSLYSFAVARSVENIQRAQVEPWRRSIKLQDNGDTLVLTAPSPVDSEHDPSNYQLVPSDSLKLGGKFFRTPSKVNGIGAPLVAVGRGQNPQFRKRYELTRIYAGVTAVVSFRGQQARLDFVDPFSNERVKINDHSFPLAADFDTPLAMLLQRERPDKLGFARLIRPEKYADTARLIRLQPFDPQRTPVIFVHGLQDTPVSWVPMVNALRADPEIARRYQLWVFSYPSGYPYPYSAVLLRRELDGIARAFPNRKPVILIGHSMGGMICRLMATDSGDKLWRNILGTSPADTKITGEPRELLREVLLFNHRRDVKRIIFISTPHRGAELASNWIGRTVTRWVKTPIFLAEARDSVVSIVKDEEKLKELKRAPSSIDTLSPTNRFVIEVNKIPITSTIPYNSIIGDRGRGDTPNSSDGVVGYWSSHLDGAESELVVPANHMAQRNPQAIAEVKRILKSSP